MNFSNFLAFLSVAVLTVSTASTASARSKFTCDIGSNPAATCADAGAKDNYSSVVDAYTSVSNGKQIDFESSRFENFDDDRSNDMVLIFESIGNPY